MKLARIAVPDLVSNSYFPAIAAIALGEFAKQGLEVRHELIFPNYKAYEALRNGDIDFVAGPAHAALKAFPDWNGARLLCALAQGMYWLLVMRADLVKSPGDINIVKGRTIGAAPLVDLALHQMILDSGLDFARDDIRIVGVPGSREPGVSFGVAAAEALERREFDGFWANAMGAENAVRRGVGKIAIDVRRGLGPSFAFNYTIPALVTSELAISDKPDVVAAGLRAVISAQRALKADISLAGKVGEKLFPPAEAKIIADVVARDLPYYTPEISEETINGINRFARATKLMAGRPPYDRIVATEFRHFWTND